MKNPTSIARRSFGKNFEPTGAAAGLWPAGFVLLILGALASFSSLPVWSASGRDQTRVSMESSTQVEVTDIAGRWKARFGGNRLRLQFDVSHPGVDWTFSTSVARDEVTRRPSGEYELARGAGVFVLEGFEEPARKRGSVSGDYRFEANPEYLNGLASLGFGDPSAGDLFQLTAQDIGVSDVKGLAEYGKGQWSLDDVVRLHNQGIEADYPSAMARAGYDGLAADELIRLHNQGLTPEYAGEIAKAARGPILPDDLIRLHNHGIEAKYLRELLGAGLEELDLDGVIRLRNHGIEADYLEELIKAGLENFALDDVIRLHNHGIEADYLKSLSEAELADVDEVIRKYNRGEAG